MNRAALAAELWGRLQRPFAEVGITNSDTSGNLKEPIDATLTALGTAYGDLATGTVESGSEAAAIALAVYYGYVAMLDGIATRVTRSMSAATPNVSRTDNYSELTDTLEAALKRAAVAASPYLPADGTFVTGSIAMDIIEPVECWS